MIETVLITAGFVFGPGYQPISIIPTILLAHLLHKWRSEKRQQQLLLLQTFFCALIGSFLAYSGCFGASFTKSASLELLPICINMVCVLCAAFSLYRYFYLEMTRKFGDLVDVFDSVLGFPMIWTAAWSVWYRINILGDFGSWHIALDLLEISSLTTGASWLFGSFSGGCFIHAIISLLISHAITVPKTDTGALSKKFRWFWIPPVLILVFTSLVGSLTTGWLPNTFYQQPIMNLAAPLYLDATCMVRADFETTIRYLEDRANSESLDSQNVKHQLILWSEQSIIITNEEETLGKALDIAKRFQVTLGIAYAERIQNTKRKWKLRNKFAIITPDMTLDTIRVHQKFYPVPLVEADTEPNPSKQGNITIVHPSYLDGGGMGGAICFDFNFPFMNRQGYSSSNITLLLQPSATWGPIGPLHTRQNRLRALDFNSAYFRCSSNGISGVYDSLGNVVAESVTLGKGDFLRVNKVPIYSRSRVTSLFQLGLEYLRVDWLAAFSLIVVSCVFLLSLSGGGRFLESNERAVKKKMPAV